MIPDPGDFRCRPLVVVQNADFFSNEGRHVRSRFYGQYIRVQLAPYFFEVLDRSMIVGAQTPQGFVRSLILECLETADPAITDDASAVLSRGLPVVTVDGEATNLKVTHPGDLRWAKAFVARST